MYYRIENKDGLCINGLDASNFVIKEKTQGGEYLSREIYETIYREQKQMYQVVYTSDESLVGQYEEREIALEVGGLGYVASEESKLVPVGEKEAQAKKEHTSRYEVYMDDISWEEANIRCNEMGGHLVTITSENEFDTVKKLAEEAGASFIWLGGYTSYNAYGDVFVHWVTGEDFVYEKWCDGEPSRVDLDGTNEWYLMMWNIESLGGWTWNDQRNDLAADLPVFQGKLAYICEYED